MNSRMIRDLSAQRQPTEVDKLDLSCRIRSADYVISIDEAISILKSLLKNKVINVDSEGTTISIDLTHNQVLEMNLYDEILCSLMHNIFMYKSKSMVDYIEYIRHRLEELIPEIDKKCSELYVKDSKEFEYFDRLSVMISNLRDLAFPVLDPKCEERFSYKLSIDYYAFLYFFCDAYSSRDKYFAELQKFYCKRIVKQDQKSRERMI